MRYIREALIVILWVALVAATAVNISRDHAAKADRAAERAAAAQIDVQKLHATAASAQRALEEKAQNAQNAQKSKPPETKTIQFRGNKPKTSEGLTQITPKPKPIASSAKPAPKKKSSGSSSHSGGHHGGGGGHHSSPDNPTSHPFAPPFSPAFGAFA